MEWKCEPCDLKCVVAGYSHDVPFKYKDGLAKRGWSTATRNLQPGWWLRHGYVVPHQNIGLIGYVWCSRLSELKVILQTVLTYLVNICH